MHFIVFGASSDGTTSTSSCHNIHVLWIQEHSTVLVYWREKMIMFHCIFNENEQMIYGDVVDAIVCFCFIASWSNKQFD